MSFVDNLSFGFTRRLPQFLQTEAAECGLACVGMIASYHGFKSDLATLRRRFPISLKGATLANLIRIANELEMGTRPVKLELEDLSLLELPCVLHWNLNHFVVLKKVTSTYVIIHDPSFGTRKLAMAEVSKGFTGIALELWPNEEFKPQEQRQRISLRLLMGRVTGIYRSFAQILLLALALEVFSLISPFFMQWVIDDVIVAGDRNLLTTLVVGFGLLMLLQQAVGTMRQWVIIYMGTTLNIQWRANVFTHLLRLPMQYFEKRHLGDVVSRFGAVDAIQRTLTTSFLSAILDGLMTSITLVLMFVYSPLLGFIAVGAMALYAFSRWMWYQPLRTATEEQIVRSALQQSHFLETIRGVKAVKLFQRQEERRATWLALLVDQVNADLTTQKLQMIYQILNGLLFGLENLLVVWLGTSIVLDGKFTVGMLTSFMAYKGQFDSRVGSLIDKYFELKMLQLQGERLSDILMAEPEVEVEALMSEEFVPADHSIEVAGLRFRYAEHEPHVLDGVNLRIEAGESIALVGPSGCGKTTLMNLLLGLLSPTEGNVMIGGIDIKKLGVDALRQMVGTVTQDDVLFAGSIADNISFFDPAADRSHVEECARLAGVSQEIVSMPMSYNTLVGDMGTVLSGGQKQRILLARALYRKPKILFLDEATSHLDVAKEHEVNARVKWLNITRVIIAHRPETIATATRVIELEDGKVKQAAQLPTVAEAAPVEAGNTQSNVVALNVVAELPAKQSQLAASAAPMRDIPFNHNDDSDLVEFGKAVGDAKIVLLCQQSNGDGNVYELKSRLVRYLHEQKGFRILAIESGSFDVERAGEDVDRGGTYCETAKGALFYMLSYASELRPLFQYLDRTRHTPNGLRMVGFDTQLTGRYSTAEFCSRLRQFLIEVSPELFDDEDWELFCKVTGSAMEMSKAVPDEDELERYFERLQALQAVLATLPESDYGILLSAAEYWHQVLSGLEHQGRRFWRLTKIDGGLVRENSMAEYVLWLAEVAYPSEKIIVWTHNLHGLRHPHHVAMGTVLGKALGEEMVTVGFTAANGHFLKWTNGQVTEIPPADPGTFEAELDHNEADYSLIDIRQPHLNRALSQIRGWRFRDYRMVNYPILESFDLMIHARRIKPSEREDDGRFKQAGQDASRVSA